MKILIIANDSTYVYNLRKELIQAMQDKHWNMAVVCEFKQYMDELQKMNCQLLPVTTDRQGKNPVKDAFLLHSYCKILKSEKPSIVLTYNIKPNIYGGIACQILRIPYLPNICGLGTPLEHTGILQHISISLYKIGVAKAQCLFFQNMDNYMFFKNHRMISAKTRTCLLPGSGVNLRLYPPLPYPTDKIIHFQYTSRILKEKGIDIYLTAAQQIHREYPNTLFHICGGCDSKAYLETLDQAQKNGYILYHGEQKDMTSFLMQASCIVHPSYYPEGMSNVLLEGAASARPIITTDRSGCRETVEDGVTGFLIPTQNTSALIDALRRFLAMTPDQRKAMGLAGRAKMEREFDRQIVIKKYMEEVCNS